MSKSSYAPHQRIVVRQIQAGFLLIPSIGALIWLAVPDLAEEHRLRLVFGAVALTALPLVTGIHLMLVRRFVGSTATKCPSIAAIPRWHDF